MDPAVTSPDPTIYLLQGVVGICIGAVIAFLVIVVTKRKTFIVLDAILGAIGFVGGALATAKLPYKLNTVTRRVGDAVISTTTHHYQHPYRAALILAVLLPVLYELYRLKIRPLFHRSA
jgi:hypothetical protein